jgi:hypothetical protein
MSFSAIHYLDVASIDAETEMAFGVTLEDGDELVWIPKSQIKNKDQFDKGDEDCTFEVSEWFAKQRGWL